MELSVSSININYRHGGFAALGSFWHDTGVLLEENKLFYITKGELLITTAAGSTVCRAGDVVLISAGTKHDYRLTDLGYAEKYWFHFTVTSGGVNLLDRYELPLVQRGEEHLEPLFRQATEKADTVPKSLSRIGAISQIVAWYLKREGVSVRKREQDEIDRLIDYLKKNLTEEFTLSELSAHVHLSKNYLIRRFRERTGVAPMKYIANLRLDRARELLATTNLTIGECMRAAGFEDKSHFSRFFKKATGYSPKGYREMAEGRKTSAFH